MRALVLILLLAAPFASALPTPGASGEATLTALGRVFPEALQTNDYVSYAEAVAGLALLGGMAPDRMEIVSLGPSRGWEPLGGGARVTADLFAVEVTNEKSPVPADEKLTLVFYLSIHGNEKGAREGGLRVIEDLARGVGLAAEDEGLLPMLDYQRLVFIFANSDGWTHEEVLNAATGEPAPPVRTVGFTRENGAGIDLNRQFPTVGYLFEEYTPLGEPEARAMVNYTSTLRNVVAGADMHGMVENTNLVRLLLKDGEKSQQRLFENERLAELYKERLNGNPHYDAWAAAPDQPGVCCGQVAEWAATFDAIGYSASGTAGAFIVQRQGLDAPGYTVEFAYNHYLTDNHYEGAGAWLNDLHVEAVRDVVAVFMKYASEKVRLSVETHGLRTAVLQTAYVATSADDEAPLSGWAAENDADDAFDVVHKPFRATPAAYWDDLAAYARAGDGVGVLDTYDDAQTLLARLGDYDQVVVPGSAAARLAGLPDAPRALRAFAEAGGNLVLTDSALALLEAMSIVPAGSVGNKTAYSGYADLVDRDHPIAAGLKGFPRQTYDPNPLGFAPGASPVWYVDREAWESAGGATVGAVGKEGVGEAVVEDPAACGEGTPLVPLRLRGDDHDHAAEALPLPLLMPPLVVADVDAAAFEKGVDCETLDATNLGVLALGEGRVHVFGAILPDPTEESNHPYGLDDYAVATNGNLALLAMLGFEFAFSTPPALAEYGFDKVLAGEAASTQAAPEETGTAKTPGPAAPLVALALLGAALAARRK